MNVSTSHAGRVAMAEHFLTAVYGEHLDGAIVISSAVPGDDRSFRGERWHTGSITELAEYVVRRSDQGVNVYQSCSILDPSAGHPPKRGTADDVMKITAAWLDLDIDGDGHKRGGLCPSLDEALDAVERFPIAPSMVVASGGGLHLYWILDEPMATPDDGSRKVARALVRDIQAAFRAHVNPWPIDSTEDGARVLRPAGTLNVKNPDEPQLVRVLKTRVQYSVDDLMARVAKLPQTAGAKHGGATNTQRTAGTAGPIADVIPTGERTDVLVSLAGSMNRRGMSVDAMTAALIAENTKRCNPPLPEEKVRAIAEDIAKRYAGQRDAETSKAQGWEDPVALDAGPRPAFPTDSLPPFMQGAVRGVAEEVQVPEDLTGLVALATLAVPCAGVVDIRLSRSSDWTEPLNLYVAPVAVSGERKSAAVSKMTEPLRIIEAQLAAPWEAKAREAKTEQAFWGARVQTLQNDLKKAGMNGWDLARDLVEAQEKLDGATAPPKPKLLAESDTPERLEMRLAEQGGRIGIFSDEGGGVFALMSSYGEGSAKIDVYLRGHDGRQPLDSGRVKRDDVYVERPLLTVMVALQPSVVEDLAQHRAMRGRGLLARFLYGVPDSRIGYRETNPRPCPKDGLADYYNRIAALTMERPDTPHVISLDDDAQDIFDAWRTSHEARMRASGDLATMTDFGSKLPGLIGRIAGDFHMGLHGPAGVTKKVSAETIRQALGFDEYLIAHARLALGLLGASDQMTNARLILKWLTEAQRAGSPVERFGRKRALQATHLHADDLTSGLIMLVEYGWVKEKVGVREDGRPNRAAVTYEVHPSLTGQIGPDPGPPATPPNGVNGVNGLIEGSESSLSLKSEYGGTNQTAPLSPKPLKDRCDRWDRSEEGTDPNVGAHPPSCYCDECILDDRS